MINWTDENTALASKMWNDGASPTDIAARLRCQDYEVRDKLRTLTLERATRPSPPADPEP